MAADDYIKRPEFDAAAMRLSEVYKLKCEFEAEVGKRPNLLIVGPNGPDAYETSMTFIGLRVIVDDLAPADFAVGYLI